MDRIRNREISGVSVHVRGNRVDSLRFVDDIVNCENSGAGACGFRLMAYLGWWGIERQRWNGRTGDNFHFWAWTVLGNGSRRSFSGFSATVDIGTVWNFSPSPSCGWRVFHFRWYGFGFRLGCTNTVFGDKKTSNGQHGSGIVIPYSWNGAVLRFLVGLDFPLTERKWRRVPAEKPAKPGGGPGGVVL